MPFTIEIDRNQQLVTSRLWGGVTEAEVREHNQKIRTDPEFNPGFRQLADMTGVTEILVSTQLVNETASDQFFAPGARRAFVTSTDAAFGMARMYALQAEGLGQTIQVFRDLRVAEEWLGLEV